jgi:hypothetical protein
VQVASLIGTTLGLKNHRVQEVALRAGRIVVDLDLIGRRRLPCSACGTFDPMRGRLPQHDPVGHGQEHAVPAPHR